jgi:hypothetical protein
MGIFTYSSPHEPSNQFNNISLKKSIFREILNHGDFAFHNIKDPSKKRGVKLHIKQAVEKLIPKPPLGTIYAHDNENDGVNRVSILSISIKLEKVNNVHDLMDCLVSLYIYKIKHTKEYYDTLKKDIEVLTTLLELVKKEYAGPFTKEVGEEYINKTKKYFECLCENMTKYWYFVKNPPIVLHALRYISKLTVEMIEKMDWNSLANVVSDELKCIIKIIEEYSIHYNVKEEKIKDKDFFLLLEIFNYDKEKFSEILENNEKFDEINPIDYTYLKKK